MKRPKNTVRSISSDWNPGRYDIYLVGFPRTSFDRGLSIAPQDVHIDSWAYLVPHLVPESQVWDYDLFEDELTAATGETLFSQESEKYIEKGSACNKYIRSAKDIEESAYILLDKAKEKDSASERAQWRPIMFVGHGLGGIVVKQAMVIANTNPKYCDIALRTYQLIFVATPRDDMSIAKWEEHLDQMLASARIRTAGRKSQILGELAVSVRDTCSFFHCALNYRVTDLFDNETSESEHMTETGLRDLLFPGILLSDRLSHAELVEPSLFYSDLLNLLQYLSPSDQLLYQSNLLHITYPEMNTSAHIDNLSEPWHSRQHSIQVVGPPGYGKLTLVKHIVRRIVRSTLKVLLLEIRYDRWDLANIDLETIIRSLVHQIVSQRPELFVHIRPLYNMHLQVSRAPMSDALWTFLHILLRVSSDWKIIFVASNVNTWPEDVKLSLQIIEDFLKSLDSTYLFITSANAVIDSLCENSREIIHLELDATYRNVLVRSRVNHMVSDLLPTSDILNDRLPVLSSLTHAERFGKSLSHCILLSTAQAVEIALSSCPNTQDEITRFQIDSLNDLVWQWSQNVVSWVHVASRPLRIWELAVGVALADENFDLQDVKQHMPTLIADDIRRHLDVILKHDEGIIQFYDESVRRYLTEDRYSSPERRVWKLLTHDQAVARCLRYITLVVKENSEQMRPDYLTWRHQLGGPDRQVELEFLDYAVRNWPRHYLARQGLQSKWQDTTKTEDTTKAAETDDLDDEVLSFLSQENQDIKDIWYRLYCSHIPGIKPSSVNLCPMEIATELNLVPIVRRLLSQGADGYSTQDLGSFLCTAVRNNNLVLVDLFLNKGAEKKEAILECAVYNRIHCLQRLLPDEELNNEVIPVSLFTHRAARAGSVSVVDYLCRASLDYSWCDEDGQTLLHAAAIGGKPEILDQLLRACPNLELNAIDKYGQTPLIRATQLGHAKFVEDLCTRQADVSLPDENGRAALHHAILKDVVIIRSLLKRGASATSTDNQKQTPMHLACNLGSVEIVMELIQWLKEGDSLNSQNQDGQTALHLAAERGHLLVTQLLLEKGADPGVKDSEDKEPFQLAAEGGHLDLFQALQYNPAINSITLEALVVQSAVRGQALIVRQLVKGLDTVNFLNKGRSPLSKAASGDYPEVVRLLLESSADPDFVDSEQRYTALHQAVFKGNLQTVTILLHRMANPNSLDENNWTPLHHAVHRNQTQMTELLLDHGADLNIQTLMKETVLHLAVGDPEIVKILLERGASLKALDYDGRTPLHVAVSKQRERSIQLLTDADTSIINVPDDSGLTPLHYALSKNNWAVETFELLWSHCGPLDHQCYQEKPVMIHAVQEKNLDGVKALINENKTLANARDLDGKSTIMFAIECDDEEILGEILQVSSDKDINQTFDDNRKTPLHYAATHGHLSIVERLLELGVDIDPIDEQGETPLHKACFNGHTETARQLLFRGANPNVQSKSGRRPLHLGADSESVVRVLTDHKAEIDAQSNNGWTALMQAVWWGSEPSMRTLLELGANINLQNTVGETALHLAELEYNSRLSSVLLNESADVSVTDMFGNTPLHYAARCSEDVDTKITDLLAQNAFIEARDEKGRTPLHLALLEGTTNAVDTLIRHKADFQTKDADDQTCLSLAVQNRRYGPEMIKLLLQAAVGTELLSIENKAAAFRIAFDFCDAAMVLAQDDRRIFQEFENLSTIVNECIKHGDMDAAAKFVTLGANPYYQGNGSISSFERAAHLAREIDEFLQICLDNRRPSPDCQFQILRVALEYGWTNTRRDDEIGGLTSETIDRDGWHLHDFYAQHNIPFPLGSAYNKPTHALLPTRFIVPEFWELTQSDFNKFTFSPDFKQVGHRNPSIDVSVRADHPFPPRNAGIQYFEIKLLHHDNTELHSAPIVGIGLTSEYSDLSHGFPGWLSQPFSMGYHNDDGCIYESSGGNESSKGTGRFYQQGDVVGCGISWNEESVYYTLNGERIGDFQTKNIYRKLYPVVTLRQHPCTFQVNFGDGWDDKGAPFMYTLDVESTTSTLPKFDKSVLLAEQVTHPRSNTSAVVAPHLVKCADPLCRMDDNQIGAIDVVDGSGTTALQRACARGHYDSVNLLLQKGAEVNAQGGYYDNALQGSARRGHLDIVQLLLENGADINDQGGYYGNALQGAAQTGHIDIVQLLLENVADVNAKGEKYDNALQGAAQTGHIDIVQQLLF
ncbi:hypothetical protein ZTR_05366 [Talaromyces verruculosus]|nr:hypothetical protein ZTR_05366 [Talaromyces verruculosus]